MILSLFTEPTNNLQQRTISHLKEPSKAASESIENNVGWSLGF
jgi:hypothetical protein